MTGYLDTSSLVKLYVEEQGSDDVRQFLGSVDIAATSMLTYAEMRATLARRRREGLLDARALTSVKRVLDHDWQNYFVVDVTITICRAAGDLAERYRLRGYDSVHLASYLEIARRAGAKQTQFSSFDQRLNLAARSVARMLGRVPSPKAPEVNR